MLGNSLVHDERIDQEHGRLRKINQGRAAQKDIGYCRQAHAVKVPGISS